MLTIAIDSSQDICTLAIAKNTEILCEYHFEHKMSLLRRIVPNIEHMMSDAGLDIQDIEGVIVSLGPGSFTGLRIGVTVAKALAYTLSKPIVGVGTLDAIARGFAPTSADLICPMIHARANEVYWSLFDSSAEIRLANYAVSSINDALESVISRAGCVYFCGNGTTHNEQKIRHQFGNRAIIAKPWAGFARGAALLEIGQAKLKEKQVDDVSTLAPLYIKKPTPVVKLEQGFFEKKG